MPHFIEPAAPANKKISPTGPEWLHEVKFDGVWKSFAHHNRVDPVAMVKASGPERHIRPDLRPDVATRRVWALQRWSEEEKRHAQHLQGQARYTSGRPPRLRPVVRCGDYAALANHRAAKVQGDLIGVPGPRFAGP